MALKSDGTLWAWGDNRSGQLGDGTTANQSSPVPVGSATNWRAVAAGAFHTVALKSDGTLWAWGNNSYGQLGDGTYANQASPVRVGSATNWQSVAAGAFHTVALKSDGTLWAWGFDSYGQLGDGSAFADLTPGKIGAPVILAPPQNQVALLGTNVSFSVVATGSKPLNYQWLFGGASLPAATNSALALSAVGINDAGNYAVLVTNNYGSVTSAVATLPLAVAPRPSSAPPTGSRRHSNSWKPALRWIHHSVVRPGYFGMMVSGERILPPRTLAVARMKRSAGSL